MATTITVQQACEQLALEESQFRALLQPLYKNADSIKRISMKSFKTIAEILQEQALQQEENQDIDVETIETEIQNQQTLLQETETNDYSTDNNSDSTDDRNNDFDDTKQEETALTTIPEQEIAVRVRQVLDTNPNLKQQTLDLSRITRTVALLASEKAVEDFSSIYAARFNQGMSAFINDFSQTALTTITEIQNQKVTDFFDQLNLNYTTVNNQATDQLKELMGVYQSPIQ